MSHNRPRPVPRSSSPMYSRSPLSSAKISRLLYVAGMLFATALAACHIPGKSIASNYKNVDPFNFDVAQGPKNYHIEGYLTRSAELGNRPGLLVLNAAEGNDDRSVQPS